VSRSAPQQPDQCWYSSWEPVAEPTSRQVLTAHGSSRRPKTSRRHAPGRQAALGRGAQGAPAPRAAKAGTAGSASGVRRPGGGAGLDERGQAEGRARGSLRGALQARLQRVVTHLPQLHLQLLLLPPAQRPPAGPASVAVLFSGSALRFRRHYRDDRGGLGSPPDGSREQVCGAAVIAAALLCAGSGACRSRAPALLPARQRGCVHTGATAAGTAA